MLRPSRYISRILAAALLAWPLSGCTAATLGTLAVSTLLAPMNAGPEAPPTIGEQLATLDPEVKASCRARLPEPSAADGVGGGQSRPVESDSDHQATAPKRCAVRPVCLPGHSQPTQMMVCPAGGPVETAAEPRQTTRPATPRWDWQAVETERSASPAGATAL